MVWLRSFLFQFYFFASVCLFALTIAVLFFTPFSVRFWLAKTWAKSMLVVGRWLCGLKYEIEGQENIRTRRASS